MSGAYILKRKNYSRIYEDDRHPKEPFAITVRGENVIETRRFRTRERAQQEQRDLKKLGFKPAERLKRS